MATIFATRGVLRRSDNTKIVFGRVSITDPAGGAYDAPPDPVVGWAHSPPPRVLVLGALTPKLKIWLRPCISMAAAI